jgi:orotate phosphoribosyltransferase
VAYHLTRRRKSGETLAVYAEEEGAERNRLFKRGYDAHVRGKNVVIVEDVVTTGGSVAKVVAAVKALDGNILAASILCNRGGIGEEAIGGVKLHALTAVSLDSYPEDDCPLCRDGVAINTKVGKGKAFLAARS